MKDEARPLGRAEPGRAPDADMGRVEGPREAREEGTAVLGRSGITL